MTGNLDEQLLDAVNAIGPTAWSGRCFRYTTARRDPLSGEGARLHGGRWNPPGLFPTIYLAIPESTCMAELDRYAEDNHLDVEALLQVDYRLHSIQVRDLAVLDLRSRDARRELGLEAEDLAGAWDACQPVGHAAWFLEHGGVLGPSATGSGLTLALFENRTLPGQVHVEESRPLSLELYRRHAG